jgi:pimeloyl-ACP methyl ester carboxylesterase
MSNEIDDIGRLVEAATAVLASARAGDGLAVVAWLGYDTPRVSQVASTRLAKTGADALTSFVRSLRITAPHADVTVIGHSYGTLVAGEAAQRGMVADRLIFVGSPGVEAARATDLLPPGRVWAARARDDPIRAVFGTEEISRWMLGGPVGLLTLRRLRVDRFGPDPVGRSFAARRFSVAGSHGHSDYFRPGSTSVRNITRIATGRLPEQR